MSSSSKESRRDDDDRSGATDGNSAGTGGSGKVAQAHNSVGDKESTQLNQGRRTPESRHDRDAHVGSSNQVQSRRGAGGNRGAG